MRRATSWSSGVGGGCAEPRHGVGHHRCGHPRRRARHPRQRRGIRPAFGAHNTSAQDRLGATRREWPGPRPGSTAEAARPPRRARSG